MKRPIILPKNNEIVKKDVLFLHRLHGHAGPSYVLDLVRRNYLIINGRRQIRSILRLCPTQRCVKPTPLGQIMAPLPKERIDEPESFKNVAVDMFGPMFVRHSCDKTDCPHDKTSKVYGCLFTCFHSRAIHLELLENASTEDFLQAFRAFVARRGCPRLMFSDNGRNFVKAAKEIRTLYKKINWKKVEQEGKLKNIEWFFNVEKAPHMNGLAEKMIASAKRPLKIILGNSQLTFRQLTMVLTEVESIVNNRPLTEVSEGLEDFFTITPSELIIGQKMDTLTDPNFRVREGQLDYKSMWRKRQLLLNAFWKKWSTSYLMNLQIC